MEEAKQRNKTLLWNLSVRCAAVDMIVAARQAQKEKLMGKIHTDT